MFNKKTFYFSLLSIIIAIGTYIYIQNKITTSKIANYEKTIFSDDFEYGLKEFWTPETMDSTRFEIVQDPIDSKNKVLKINIELNDYVNSGSRSEMKIQYHPELNYLSNYSFRFMLPESFFAQDEKPGILIIHQWHDQADPGFDWGTQKKITHPAIYLFIDRKEGGTYFLTFRTGLETGNINETVTSVWEEELVPNRWYNFSCEVLWHIYSNVGYALPVLDGKYFYKQDTDKKTEMGNSESHKIYRRNMYNGDGNYVKIGLYKFGNEKHNRTIYFDDFHMYIQKTDCSN